MERKRVVLVTGAASGIGTATVPSGSPRAVKNRIRLKDLVPPMIDNPKQVADLLSKLEAALPLPAIVTPRLAAT